MTARLIRSEVLAGRMDGQELGVPSARRSGEWRLPWFTDADTIHAPGTVSAAVDYACRKMRAWFPRGPTDHGDAGGETHCSGDHSDRDRFCPLWLQRLIQYRGENADPRLLRHIGVANGQFMFFTRACYDAIGGHASVRSHVVEDVALGREVRRG